MKIRVLIISFLSIMTLIINAQNKIIEKIENKTWFDKTGFAGESIVFMESDSGQIKAIRQINGSGVPVVFTEIYDVEIRMDTIFLLDTPNEKTSEKQNNIFYTYNDQQGLLSNGKQLRILFEEPIIYVCTEKRKITDTRVNVNALTKISFEKNEVYIKNEVYKINIED